MIEKIRLYDLSDPKTSIYSSRSETELFRMNEPKPGIFIAETELVIRRALNAGFVPISMLCLDKGLDTFSDLIDLCDNSRPAEEKENENLNVYYAPDELLKDLLGFPLTRGVLCAMKRTKATDINEVLKNAQNIAILCDVENPTNVGTIFRNAAALNIDAVLLIGSCSDPYYRRSLRAGMGCQFMVPWTFLDRIETIKEMGFNLAAFALREDTLTLSEYADKKIAKKAIILGNEGFGLPNEVLNMCDSVIKIPMREGVDSLNVAVASGIAFYELTK